jgi:hypothetical protein
VSVCAGDDYVFRINGAAVDVTGLHIAQSGPYVGAVDNGNGIRIFGRSPGGGAVEADVVPRDGGETVHVKINVVIIDCHPPGATVPPIIPPSSPPRSPGQPPAQAPAQPPAGPGATPAGASSPAAAPPSDLNHAQAAGDSTADAPVFHVTVCTGGDYVFPISGGAVDVTHVHVTQSAPDVGAVDNGNGIRIFGRAPGGGVVDADVTPRDGGPTVHVRINVEVIDCPPRNAGIPSPGAGTPPPSAATPPPGAGTPPPVPPRVATGLSTPPAGQTAVSAPLAGANSALYGGAPVDPTKQYVIVSATVVPGGSPSGLLFDSEAVSFRLVAYQPAAPAFAIVANGGLGTGSFEFRLQNPPAELANTTLAEGLVLEPLAPSTRDPTAGTVSPQMTQSLTAYCLERTKQPPDPKQLYRIAAPAIQARYAPLRGVLAAGSTLASLGVLHPDSEPRAYADFVRQQALWASLEGWGEKEFTQTFIEHTRKTAEHMNVKWTQDMEQSLRAAAPGRWRDVSAVLDQARRLEAGGAAH